MILRLRAGSETLILGPRAAFAALAGRDRGALVSEYEVRRRLRIALADPEGADALRRAFARWREEGARIREADDRALIDRVARMSRGGMIVAFVVADRTKRLPAAPASSATPAGSGSGPQLASMNFHQRIAATLQRVPNHLEGSAKQEFLVLVEPRALAIAAGVLAVWAGSHAVGIGEAVDVMLAAMGLFFAGAEFWRGIEALFHALALMRTAQSEKQLDEAAAIFAVGATKVGVTVLVAAIARSAAKKAARWTEKKPSLRNTPPPKSEKKEILQLGPGPSEGRKSLPPGQSEGRKALPERKAAPTPSPPLQAPSLTKQRPWTLGEGKSATKWAGQMEQRGWTPTQIDEALASGKQFPAPNNLDPANGATRFVHPETGRSVVIDNITGKIIHVGGDGFKY